MNDILDKTEAFRLKGRLYTLTVLQILDENLVTIEQQLKEVVAKAPRLFERTPVVLDCSNIQSIDFKALCELINRYGLLPVALQGQGGALHEMAQSIGLALLKSSSAQDKPLDLEDGVVLTRAKLITTPVRSGQQCVSQGSDLVVTASVGHGAELLSDGHIHVYGALRGRALAGSNGNRQARIFCHALDAELISIAGFYQLRDTFEPTTTPTQIYLHDERLVIEPL